jgi:hypothetical protein
MLAKAILHVCLQSLSYGTGSARDTTGQTALNLRTWTSMSAPSSSSGSDSLSSCDKRPCASVYGIQAVVLGVRQTLVGHLFSTWGPAVQ